MTLGPRELGALARIRHDPAIADSGLEYRGHEPVHYANRGGRKKPHLSYEDQVTLLEARGLDCSDRAAAAALLRSVGYYRLSAYVYPFRALLPEAERKRESPAHFRSDVLAPGTTIQHVEGLWRFDRKLRLLCLDAVETVEIGIRTKIAYVLGARDPFGHVNRESLTNSRAPLQ